MFVACPVAVLWLGFERTWPFLLGALYCRTRYLAVFLRGEELYGAGFENGAGFVVRTMLQSPHFLYRTELGPAGEPLTGYETASKLSFWLRGTTPSDALLDAVRRRDRAD